MIMATVSVLNKFRSEWENIPVLTTIMNELIAHRGQIDELRSITEIDMTGATRDKNVLEDNLVQSVYTIASGLTVIANRMGNNELAEKVDFTISELEKSRDAELISTCNNVVSLARENIDLLTECNLGEANIAELEELLTQMRSSIIQPRVSVAERKAANERLEEEIDRVVKILDEQVDLLMIRFKLSNPGFFAEYMNARHIVAYGVRHESEEDTAA